MSDYSDSRRKGSSSLLSTNSKSITAYDADFDDTLEMHGVIEADDEEPINWKELQSLVERERTSPPPEESEIKGIRVAVGRSSNEDSVSASVFPRSFPVDRVNTCHTLKEHWNRQWTHWSPPYPNSEPRVAPPQPGYAIGYHTRLFPGQAIRRLQGLASPSKNKLSFPVFFAELKGASGAMNVAKLQNRNNGASAVYNLLRAHQAVGLESDFYDKAWVLSLDTNGEMWRLRCHWVSTDEQQCRTYYSKVLGCWAVEDPRDTTILEARASMRNILDYIREVSFKGVSALVDNYEKPLVPELSQSKLRQTTKNVRPEPDSDVQAASNHSFTIETQSLGFASQPNAASDISEVLRETGQQSRHRGQGKTWSEAQESGKSRCAGAKGQSCADERSAG